MTLLSTEVEDDAHEGSLETLRFSCRIDDVAENDPTSVSIPIAISDGASARPISATVRIESGTMALEVQAIPTTTSQLDGTLCDPNGVTLSGSDAIEASKFPADGTITGSVSDVTSHSLTPVRLFGFDSCNHWISRTAHTSPDGSFSFMGLLPGKYALELQDASIATAVELTSGNMNAVGITL